MKFGFIYLWYDTIKKKYYLGSHIGSLNDGYIGSNAHLKNAYKKRPETFKRRILESHNVITSKQLLKREQMWLNLIKPQELSSKYYNKKTFAAGGDIVSQLPEEKRKEHSIKCGIASKTFWNNISYKEYQKRKENAFGGNNFNREYMTQRNKELCSKKALIVYPDGTKIEITNVSEFCKNNNINYQNFKTMLRGDTKRKSCSKFKGYYL